MLVGAATADDAGVFLLNARQALVQTVDFFTPIVDDPYRYGLIAAANSLSDVYAMGGRPLTALNIMGVPDERLAPEIVRAILRGGAAKAREAGCVIVGGHTIKSPEPFYGLSVTGLVSRHRVMTNAAARPGDWLVLTKPLGTGIVTTGIKQGIVPAALARRTMASMARLNVVGADVAERGWVRAGTDITGFGLLGHVGALCRASGVGAELWPDRVPVLGRGVWDLIARDCVPGGTRRNLDTSRDWTEFLDVTPAQQYLLADAQTSGGLLLCVPERRMGRVTAFLRRQRAACVAVVGRVTRAFRGRIVVRGGRDVRV